MNPFEPSSVLPPGHPFQFALWWWGAASQAVQTFWVAHKVASTCVDRLGRAAISVGFSLPWLLAGASNVPASPATPPLVPDPEHPITPHPGPDPIPPGINDPPPVEVPPPMQEPPVMPPPVARDIHDVFGDGEPEGADDGSGPTEAPTPTAH